MPVQGNSSRPKTNLPSEIWTAYILGYESTEGVRYEFMRNPPTIHVHIPLPSASKRTGEESPDVERFIITRAGAVVVRGKVNHQMEVTDAIASGEHMAWFVVDHAFELQPDSKEITRTEEKGLLKRALKLSFRRRVEWGVRASTLDALPPIELEAQPPTRPVEDWPADALAELEKRLGFEFPESLIESD